MSTHDLPVPGTIAAKIDLRARLRVFDFDGTLASASREAWAVLEPVRELKIEDMDVPVRNKR